MSVMTGYKADHVKACAEHVGNSKDPREALNLLENGMRAQVLDRMVAGRGFQRFMAIVWLVIAITFPMMYQSVQGALPPVLYGAVIVISATLAARCTCSLVFPRPDTP